MTTQQAKPVVERPAFCADEHLEYLDALRESGITNMFGSSVYLFKEYRRGKSKLTEEQSRAVVAYWMKTFSARHGGGA